MISNEYSQRTCYSMKTITNFNPSNANWPFFVFVRNSVEKNNRFPHLNPVTSFPNKALNHTISCLKTETHWKKKRIKWTVASVLFYNFWVIFALFSANLAKKQREQLKCVCVCACVSWLGTVCVFIARLVTTHSDIIVIFIIIYT